MTTAFDDPAEFSPDKPRAWDPNHPSLNPVGAPHETAGALRMQRNGYNGEAIAATLGTTRLGIKRTDVVDLLNAAVNGEEQAQFENRPVHCETIPKDYA